MRKPDYEQTNNDLAQKLQDAVLNPPSPEECLEASEAEYDLAGVVEDLASHGRGPDYNRLRQISNAACHRAERWLRLGNITMSKSPVGA